MKTEFKVGHCLNCGNQTMVTDTNNFPVKGLIGTRVYWIVLSDEHFYDDNGRLSAVNGKNLLTGDPVDKERIFQKTMNPVTRIGSITICKDCDPLTLNVDELVGNLIDSPVSLLPKDTPELKRHPHYSLELIKRYGD